MRKGPRVDTRGPSLNFTGLLPPSAGYTAGGTSSGTFGGGATVWIPLPTGPAPTGLAAGHLQGPGKTVTQFGPPPFSGDPESSEPGGGAAPPGRHHSSTSLSGISSASISGGSMTASSSTPGSMSVPVIAASSLELVASSDTGPSSIDTSAGASLSTTRATADTSSPSRRFITRTPCDVRP